MFWPFIKSKSKKSAESDNGKLDEEAEIEARRRASRRRAAEQRILKTLRKADEDRKATETMEETHVAEVKKRRKRADTAARQAQEKASEILGEEASA
jgi:hypothetical protein